MYQKNSLREVGRQIRSLRLICATGDLHKLAAVSAEIYRGGGRSARSNDGGIRYQ